MSNAGTMTADRLRECVRSGAAALRCVRRLQPAGGKGDKIFPPTYEGGQYAVEERMIEGQRVPCVLLDSVQSQANRMELALLRATRETRIQAPLVEVDFAGQEGLTEVGAITSLEAPHRLADAILRDCTLNGVRFRESPEGNNLNTASLTNATAVFGLCPTALLLGLWDSTGPRGGLGVKFQRCLVGEIIAINAVGGVRPSSRIDPLGIMLNAGPLFQAPDGGWTLDESAARKEKGKAVRYGKEGKPSEANHGNVTPSIKGNHGGITMDHALQTVVVSIPALRRLEFPLTEDGTRKANLEARVALTALGICGATLAIEDGCDLRSRCLLVPEPGVSGWEIVKGDGAIEAFNLNAESACALLNDTVAAARAAGLPWRTEPLRLTPSAGLAALVRKSRELAMQAAVEDGE